MFSMDQSHAHAFKNPATDPKINRSTPRVFWEGIETTERKVLAKSCGKLERKTSVVETLSHCLEHSNLQSQCQC